MLPVRHHRFRCLRTAAALGVVLLCSIHARAQSLPVNGIVWDAPDDLSVAFADLRAMHAMGIEAVRTGVVTDDRILVLADSLGLRLYQDLPIALLPVTSLVDTLTHAQMLLDSVLTRSASHPSARHFGLAYKSNTSVASACPFFASLTELVRRVPGARTYYTTAFVERDVCNDAVDFVLIDALGATDPREVAERWVGDVPVGFASVGRYALEGTSGLQHPRSTESQARYLETHLPGLLESDLAGVFVHRWRDRAEATTPWRKYGLLDLADTRRTSYAVVQGIYTGTQTTFVFPLGSPGRIPFPWFVVLSLVAVMLSWLLLQNRARFRRMFVRYFVSHSFYVDAVADGRELMPLTTAGVLVIEALCAGIIVGIVFGSAEHHIPSEYVLQLLPDYFRAQLPTLAQRPWALVGTAGATCAILLVAVPVSIAVLFRPLHNVSAAKAFMVVVWPHWYAVPLALVASSLSSEASPRTLAWFTAVWVAAAALGAGRAWIDLIALNPRRIGQSVVLFVLLPVLLFAGLLLLMVMINPELPARIGFLWHLATRA